MHSSRQRSVFARISASSMLPPCPADENRLLGAPPCGSLALGRLWSACDDAAAPDDGRGVPAGLATCLPCLAAGGTGEASREEEKRRDGERAGGEEEQEVATGGSAGLSRSFLIGLKRSVTSVNGTQTSFTGLAMSAF